MTTTRAAQYATEFEDTGFQEWLEVVDTIVMETAGVSTFDLADYLYYDAYDDGVDPDEVAEAVLHEEGFPF